MSVVNLKRMKEEGVEDIENVLKFPTNKSGKRSYTLE